MKKTLFVLFFLSSSLAYSQSFYPYRFEEPWSISATAGASQYFGELYNFWKYSEGIQPNWNVNINANYTFGTNLKARAQFSYYKISGSDAPSDPRAERIPRNLDFQSTNWEMLGMVEYYLFPVKKYAISRAFWNPYIFAGLGISSNNPKTQLDGEWVELRPLQLENNPYEKYVVVFPMGLGLKYKLNVYMDLIIEGNYRFTMTDYLDDISAYNISEFYLDLVDDYVTGNNPDRLRLAVRNPDFMDSNGMPDVDKILENGGRIRRGSGLDNRYDGYMSVNVGVEIYLSKVLWDYYK
ncbi:DUF6089 family protein [Algoriphagus chordae]|uniref:Outer membrane protein beta-barrel domain-containing protein n=1 Tax=Algoriphagus chordae TaxID=237019 RepID=A0A2W7R557_9BACT|nr:DUF6089 family protein [Algoriphagus chordae]PZX55624.1 Outer membrane protein beta-barrel domain-containing protein [Algoriphagus chordae]